VGALKLVCRSSGNSDDASDSVARRRHRTYVAAIRTLSVAVPYDARLRGCDRPYSWPGLHALRLYAPTFAYNPEALRDVLVRGSSDSGDDNVGNSTRKKGSSKGIQAVLFTDHVPVEAGVSRAQRRRMENKSHDVVISMMREALQTLAQVCPRLTELDLGPALVFTNDLEYFHRLSEHGTDTLSGVAEAHHVQKRQKRDGGGAAAASFMAATGSRRNTVARPKKPTVAARFAARSQNPFSAVKTLGVLIHPKGAPALVALVRYSVSDLTLRLVDDNDEHAVADAIATVATLGAQLRRFALQRYGWPLTSPEPLRPLRRLTQLRALHVSFEEGPRGFPAFNEGEAAADAAKAAAADDAWRSITERMRHLQHLSVRVRDCLTPRTFRAVGEQCRQLVTLSLAAPCDFDALGEALPGPVFPALLELRVGSAGFVGVNAR
jgi:hypothetical protein